MPEWHTLHVTLMRPKSRGVVLLASADPMAAPVIDPAFLSHRDDLERLMRGTRRGYEILQADALAPHRGPMLYPFPHGDDAGVEAFVRRHTDTEYHPVGTCAMGPAADPMAVPIPTSEVKSSVARSASAAVRITVEEPPGITALSVRPSAMPPPSS